MSNVVSESGQYKKKTLKQIERENKRIRMCLNCLKRECKTGRCETFKS